MFTYYYLPIIIDNIQIMNTNKHFLRFTLQQIFIKLLHKYNKFSQSIFNEN